MVEEYLNSENYLLELVEEFKYGMWEAYKDQIEFKDVEYPDMGLFNRFSNFLYNVLLIIDFQKSKLDEFSESQEPQEPEF